MSTSVEELLGGSIEIRSELSEGSDFSVLCKFEFKGTSDLFHSFNLGSRSDTGYRKTDIDGRSDTFVEELSFQEDLTVSDGNDISGDIGRDITSLSLNDREGSERSSSVFLVKFGSSFEETGVEIEDVSRVGLSSRGSSEQ